jgi:hypothetical protein
MLPFADICRSSNITSQKKTSGAFVWCEEEIPSDNKFATRIYHGAYQGTVCGKRN